MSLNQRCENVHSSEDEVSWFLPYPKISMELVEDKHVCFGYIGKL